METTKLPTSQQFAADCICLNTQRAARVVARRYDTAFRPIGLTSGQFSILAGLNQAGPVNLGTLADALGLERTTLTRNLVPLEAAGLVRSQFDTADRRVRGVMLTALGRDKLRLAVPLWHDAQATSQTALQGVSWSDTQGALSRLSAA